MLIILYKLLLKKIPLYWIINVFKWAKMADYLLQCMAMVVAFLCCIAVGAFGAI
jgi:hypothetical protein